MLTCAFHSSARLAADTTRVPVVDNPWRSWSCTYAAMSVTLASVPPTGA